MKTINTEYYKFIFNRDKITINVEYLDGTLIELHKLNIVNIGITPNNGIFTLTIITKEGIQKLHLNITNNLETIGFKFTTLSEAIVVQASMLSLLFGDINNKTEDLYE